MWLIVDLKEAVLPCQGLDSDSSAKSVYGRKSSNIVSTEPAILTRTNNALVHEDRLLILFMDSYGNQLLL